jgi:transcriptional regulator GlxA family with amidase domain
LPLTPDAESAPSIAPEESDAALAALKPPKRGRPLIAVVGINDSTELTDYLVPLGILRRAAIADVVALATNRGPIALFPAALNAEAEATLAEFDAKHPEGADYVIVPGMSRDDDPVVLAWLKQQAAKRATVIGVCTGAKVVAAAGLLDGKRATTHWYYLKQFRRRHPTIHYIADRRIVVNPGVVTTTGITASIPFCLTLIEAISGRDKAQAVAKELGVDHWDARHRSAAFKFTRPFAVTAMRNRLAFWNHEELGLELTPDIDEVAMALVADAWSRTFRSRAVTFTRTTEAVRTRSGLRLFAARISSSWAAPRRIAAIERQKPSAALDEALRDIGVRYGAHTTDFVAMQLEYPRRSS